MSLYSYSFRCDRRIAFFFSIRLFSLFEMNHRLRRTVLKTPLFTTFLRKRFSNESCDSFCLKFTVVKNFTSFQRWNFMLPVLCTRRDVSGHTITSPGDFTKKYYIAFFRICVRQILASSHYMGYN